MLVAFLLACSTSDAAPPVVTAWQPPAQPALAGCTGVERGGRARRHDVFAYDADGHLTRWSRGLQEMTWKYDLRGRLVSIHGSDGGGAAGLVHAWDHVGPMGSFRGTASLSWEGGRMVQRTFVRDDNPTHTQVEAYAYDANGHVLTRTTRTTLTREPRTWTTIFTWEGDRLAAREGDGRRYAYQYDADGHPVRTEMFDTNGALGSTWAYTWEEGRLVGLTRWKHAISDGPVLHRVWRYDAEGRVIAVEEDKSDAAGADGEADVVTTFEYDGDVRISARFAAENVDERFTYAWECPRRRDGAPDRPEASFHEPEWPVIE